MVEFLKRGNALSVLILTAGIGLGAQASAAASAPYGAYSLFTQGSGRVLGMGGVSAATIDDATAVNYNPAAAALNNWRFDFGATNNRVDNHETASRPYPIYEGYQAQSQPYSFLFYSGAARLGWLVLGAGYSTPYQFIYDDGYQSASLKITSLDAMLALRLHEHFAIGVTGHFQTLFERVEEQELGAGEAQGKATSFSAGAIYRTKKGGLGITYFQGYQIGLDSAAENPTTRTTWFRDVKIPTGTTIGGFYRVRDKVVIAVDLARHDVPKDVVDPVSGIAGTDIPLSSGLQSVLHGGIEWKMISEKDLDVVLRGGGYVEPGRAERSESRFHRTYGLMVRFGPASLTVSFDQAAGFNSTTQGFSLALGAI